MKKSTFSWIADSLAALVSFPAAHAVAQTPAAADALPPNRQHRQQPPRLARPPRQAARILAARARSRRAALAGRADRDGAQLAENFRGEADERRVVPDLHRRAIIYDPKTSEILWEQNSQTQRSIASITKVMTATVFLENNPTSRQVASPEAMS